MADSSISITAGTGTPIRALTGLGAGAAAQQVVTLGDSAGNLNPAFPDGSLTVDTGAHSMFMDPFDTAPGSSGYWTTGGTAPGGTGGSATLPLPTTINALSYMKTASAVFHLFAQAYLKAGFATLHEASATTNNKRFWGLGTYTTPTYATPVTNGVGFLLDGANSGNLYGAVYSNGTLSQSVLLTRQADAASHRYQVYFKQTRVYFEIDGVIVGSLPYPNMTQSTSLSAVVVSVNNSTAASQATTFTHAYVSVADSGDNASAIMSGDPAKGWVRANVAPASTGAAAADPALVVALSPNSPVMQAPATLVVSASAAAAAGTATLPAAGAGLFHYITNVTIQRTTTAATTGAASSFVTGGTNHSLVFQLPSDTQAIGFSQTVISYSPGQPLKVTAANTATTFTTPSVTATTYRITVTYYTAP